MTALYHTFMSRCVAGSRRPSVLILPGNKPMCSMPATSTTSALRPPIRLSLSVLVTPPMRPKRSIAICVNRIAATSSSESLRGRSRQTLRESLASPELRSAISRRGERRSCRGLFTETRGIQNVHDFRPFRNRCTCTLKCVLIGLRADLSSFRTTALGNDDSRSQLAVVYEVRSSPMAILLTKLRDRETGPQNFRLFADRAIRSDLICDDRILHRMKY